MTHENPVGTGLQWSARSPTYWVLFRGVRGLGCITRDRRGWSVRPLAFTLPPTAPIWFTPEGAARELLRVLGA